jgi:hypothetical protein
MQHRRRVRLHRHPVGPLGYEKYNADMMPTIDADEAG